ncbi:hypothetical protein [Aquibacillus rhizosphaerae]|uniref:Uncharacterized protein n=1 Tax=Aquibacillus rhizosphaerae TaxID=3051431 RepID=A0ABT7LBD0_9BACI|nr:hypothetical protein [Aquibacillus sp. LR5S19]MDL4842495.1 hypothetical protein [Aquibacillus sp. LR5S19]
MLFFFLFKFQKERYITRDDFESEFFVYQSTKDQKFFFAESLTLAGLFLEILYKKYNETMENGQTFDYDELLENDSIISKKRKQHLKVIFSINNIK